MGQAEPLLGKSQSSGSSGFSSKVCRFFVFGLLFCITILGYQLWVTMMQSNYYEQHLTKLRLDYKRLRLEKENLDKKVEAFQNQINQGQGMLGVKTKEVSDTKQHLESVQKELRESNEEISQLKSMNAETKKTLQERVDYISRREGEHRAERTKLQMSIDECNTKMRDAAEDLRRAKQQIGDLKGAKYAQRGAGGPQQGAGMSNGQGEQGASKIPQNENQLQQGGYENANRQSEGGEKVVQGGAQGAQGGNQEDQGVGKSTIKPGMTSRSPTAEPKDKAEQGSTITKPSITPSQILPDNNSKPLVDDKGNIVKDNQKTDSNKQQLQQNESKNVTQGGGVGSATNAAAGAETSTNAGKSVKGPGGVTKVAGQGDNSDAQPNGGVAKVDGQPDNSAAKPEKSVANGNNAAKSQGNALDNPAANQIKAPPSSGQGVKVLGKEGVGNVIGGQNSEERKTTKKAGGILGILGL